MSLWYAFTAAEIKRVAPTSGGIYLIRQTSTKGMIYVGQASDMEERLLAHRNGTSSQSSCILKYAQAQFAWEEVSYSNRTIRETQLINRYDPVCNKT